MTRPKGFHNGRVDYFVASMVFVLMCWLVARKKINLMAVFVTRFPFLLGAT